MEKEHTLLGVVMEWPECPSCGNKELYGLLPVKWQKGTRGWNPIDSESVFICTHCNSQTIGEGSLIWTKEIYDADTGALLDRQQFRPDEIGQDDMGLHGEERV